MPGAAKLSEWLPYWLDNIVKPHRKRTTFAKYEIHVRLYLVPLLGSKRLESMSVADVRRALAQLQKKTRAATAKEPHQVLRTALTAACREELVSRNVATLVEPPKVDPREMDSRSLQETLDFLAAARTDPLYVRSGCGLSGNGSAERRTRTTPRAVGAGRRCPCPAGDRVRLHHPNQTAGRAQERLPGRSRGWPRRPA